VAITRDGTENAKEMVFWQDCQEAETDKRGGFQAAAEKVRMRGLDDVVETGNLLVELTPQTSQSPNGGIRRRRIAGRGLVRPSDCGSGVGATSPAFIAA